MRVLQMLQMLQRFFALATHKGKFETEEDFADTIVPCYDLESMMGILSFDYARCAWDLDGLHLLRWSCTSKTQKTRKRGESSGPFVINEKFR